MRIALAQMNSTVGDLPGNAAKIMEFAQRAKAAGCGLLVTPEMALVGYPPQDLLLKKHFITDQQAVMTKLVADLPLPTLVGFVDRDASGYRYNAAALVADGEIVYTTHKTLLPTYDVFDEWRYFKPAKFVRTVEFRGVHLGITICEDIWDTHYNSKVVPQLAIDKAELLINMSASPFHPDKQQLRLATCQRHAATHGIPVLYCNGVGAETEIIFDGGSLALDAQGRQFALAKHFSEELLVCEPFASRQPIVEAPSHRAEHEVFQALTLGIADYFRKCGFKLAALGLSGGIDSALVACLAAEALGSENVICVSMPSRFTSDMSNDDAALLAKNLGTQYHVMPIEDSVKLAAARYQAEFGKYRKNLTLENLQARERGKILMEISNDRDALVLATGNKTEFALGYSTLYGDMCGGLAVIGDVDKPTVYALARHYNAAHGREIIPERIIERAPSAELATGQVDPFDYERIGPLTDCVVEEHASRDELIARGYSAEEVERVFRLVRLSEHKRRQAPPILRVSERAFGIGRKMPIVNHYRY